MIAFILPLAVIVLLLILAAFGVGFDMTLNVLTEPEGLKYLAYALGGGWFLAFTLEVLLYLLSDHISVGSDAVIYGAILGGGICYIAAGIAIGFLLKPFAYMGHITNLINREDDPDFAKLLDHNLSYLRAFGKDGIFLMTERSFDWYALVVNPFADYAFRYGNMLFMMMGWNGSEILLSNPPQADDSLTDRQWQVLQKWLEMAIEHRRNLPSTGGKQVVPIIGLHTPVFCPIREVDLDVLYEKGREVYNEKDTFQNDHKLMLGTMEEHRKEFIDKLFKLAQGKDPALAQSIPVISLAGHTHVYDIFRIDEDRKVYWFQKEHITNETLGFWDKGLHITTSCAGPPSDDKAPDEDTKELEIKARQKAKPLLPDYDDRNDNTYNHDPESITTHYKKGDRVMRPAGCRILTFDQNNGLVLSIDEISADTAKWGDA